MTTSIESITSHLLTRQPLPPLEPGKTVFSLTMKQQIKHLETTELIKAALNLANDDIAGCHEIVEKMQGEKTADVLHAILHRREADYWNSKWWWNRIKHPLYPSTKPCKSFVDACERAARSDERGVSGVDVDLDVGALEKQQWEEMRRVLEWVLEHEG